MGLWMSALCSAGVRTVRVCFTVDITVFLSFFLCALVTGLTNVLIISSSGQRRLLNALKVNVNV